MAEQKSKGLLGLSNYRSSRVSTSLYEPIYGNMFTIQLDPPTGLGLSSSDEEVLVILEGAQSVSGIDTAKSSGSVKEQKYKFAVRSFAGAQPSTTVDLQINWQLNLRYTSDTPSNYTYNFLRAWNDLIYDPLTGRMGLKKDYVAPSMTVTRHDRVGNPFMQWIFYNIFPTTNIGFGDFDYGNDNLWTAQMTYRADF